MLSFFERDVKREYSENDRHSPPITANYIVSGSKQETHSKAFWELVYRLCIRICREEMVFP